MIESFLILFPQLFPLFCLLLHVLIHSRTILEHVTNHSINIRQLKGGILMDDFLWGRSVIEGKNDCIKWHSCFTDKKSANGVC